MKRRTSAASPGRRTATQTASLRATSVRSSAAVHAWQGDWQVCTHVVPDGPCAGACDADSRLALRSVARRTRASGRLLHGFRRLRFQGLPPTGEALEKEDTTTLRRGRGRSEAPTWLRARVRSDPTASSPSIGTAKYLPNNGSGGKHCTKGNVELTGSGPGGAFKPFENMLVVISADYTYNGDGTLRRACEGRGVESARLRRPLSPP